MDIKLITLILLLVLTVRGHSEENDHFLTKTKTSIKGVLKTVRRIVQSAEKFTAKMFDKLALKSSLKAGEKLTMKTSEKLTVKVVEKVASKGSLKFVSKTSGKLVRKLPYLGVAAGLAFGIWRIIDDPDDWQSYALAVGELGSGVISVIPDIGTIASTAIDAGLLAFDFKYAKHDEHTQEESEEAQEESEQVQEEPKQVQEELEQPQGESEQVKEEPEQAQEEIDHGSEL